MKILSYQFREAVPSISNILDYIGIPARHRAGVGGAVQILLLARHEAPATERICFHPFVVGANNAFRVSWDIILLPSRNLFFVLRLGAINQQFSSFFSILDLLTFFFIL